MFSHHFPQPLVLRAWLHGEFQPGLKFRSAHRAEILLRLHGQFQPGRKTQISVRKFTEVRKHNRCACSRSFFSPGWKNDSDYMDFSARLAGLKILARFENTGLGFSARAELRPQKPVWNFSPGWNSPCNRALSSLCLKSHVLRDIIRVVFWWDNRRHCRSANNNLPFQSILSLLRAFQANFKLKLVSRQRNDREPNGEVYKFLVLRDAFGVVFQSATLSIWQW